jgi:hypothetical protein
MTDSQAAIPQWWARGTIFENCNCNLLCRAYISWKQPCDYERCLGFWAIHFREGEFKQALLGGLNAFVFLDMPQVMVEGGGTQAIYIDERAGEEQRAALEAILAGKGGGGLSVLAGFISHRVETRFVPIHFEDQGKRKSIRIDGIVESEIHAIQGMDKDKEVRMENIRNLVFGTSPVLARGTSRFKDGELALTSEMSHAVYSQFDWRGP